VRPPRERPNRALRGNKAKVIRGGAKVKDSILLVLSLLQND
jgi:hypothetical protein